MPFVIISLIITVLCVIAFYRGLKERNMLTVGLSAVTVLVFGFFSVMSLFEAVAGWFSS